MTTVDESRRTAAPQAPTLADASPAARVAGPQEAIGPEELQLAARNHGIPLEALRYDVTPAGLHYLLIHYDIPDVDAAAHTLAVTGAVHRPLTVDLADLRGRTRVTRRVTLECAGNGRALLRPRPVSQPWLVEAVGNAEWTGTPLAPLLREAGLSPDAVDVVFTGADHGVERGVEQDYQRALPVADALREEVLLAYEMNGAPLLPQHGAPLRLIVPGWYGMAHVKWLRTIEVRTEPFDGYQNAVAYRLRRDADDPGTPVTRIEPRALVRPPGFPDFMSRTRVLRPGPCTLDGRAWSGHAPVVSVEVTTDGGATWNPAELDDQAGGEFSWRRWRMDWPATPGRYVLGARAADASGRVQPVEQPWNRGGFANNMVQRVEVVVLAE
ncbi:sulfoxide reductase catalytic subunit YedY [Micromonospora nigra]|uniref:Sulfoxide reductase catalytic subunit YedY n=1 Tax=Micromonospora nigra TaxID=145857 RepID=A0A1C6SL23_9ACTN|nr:sulfite oxidase [Micromonospora nigra]SCL30221.1 sulfoxide reductase catalytic subunit YedY [Micromonospora nigra]